MHKTPIQIRFNDVDQMGHVNNAVIMEYLDLGKDAFFSSHGVPPTKGDFTVMVVHYDVDFKAWKDGLTAKHKVTVNEKAIAKFDASIA